MRIPRWMLGLAAMAAVLPASLTAQGVTTGAVSGNVTNEQGQPVEGVQIQVRNASTGARAGTVTRADGRYYVQGLEVGGPYQISARRIGFSPEVKNDVRISLGQNFRADFVMRTQAARLSAVSVSASVGSAVMSTAHKGAATTITDSSVTRLPTLNRNFTDFVALTPQISTKGPGNSAGGQNNRFNAIQIDGSVGNDLFGLGSTGQPGGQAGAKQVPLAAVKEYQVLLSPYDVRQGNFTGALVNAVTKAGSNEFHGEVFGVTRSEKFERDVPYLRDAPFKQSQYGFWVGGPIIQDRLLFSISPEFQQQTSPASGPYFGQPGNVTPAVPVTQTIYDSVAKILTTKYSYPTEIGDGNLANNENPLANVFARFDLINLPANSRAVFRYNYADAQTDVFSRSSGSFKSSTNGYNFKSTTNSMLGQLFSSMTGGSSNELLVGFTTIRDKRITPLWAPMVTISNVPNPNGGTTSLVFGTENSSQGNELDQDILEFTDNFTIPRGNHQFTIGTKNEWFKVRNLFAQNSLGNYTFGSIDSLNLGRPNRVQIGLKLDASDGAARFTARTLGFYAEDEWQATPTLALNYGLRADFPGLTSAPGTNQRILDSLGVNTADVPRNVMQLSPRFGFNWDATGDQVNQFRGGIGVFVGRPAYVWLSNAFGNSGVNGYANITCTNAAQSPTFPGAAGAVPSNCNTAAAPAITVNTLDPNLKFPQTLRSSLGYDRRLPYDITATIEGIYTKSLQNFFYDNINLKDTTIIGAKGRRMYGTISGNTISPLYKRPTGIGDVIHLTNQSGDYAYSLTTQLQKRFSDNFEGQLAYTYGHSYDVASMTSSVAYSNWQFGRSVKGDIHEKDVTLSKFDSPHRIIANGTYSFPSKTDVGFIFTGESGVPFDFVYSGDMNGDGSTSNDLIYVPLDARNTAEIQFATNGTLTPAQQADAFEDFINRNQCLSSQRGTIMNRNTCRTPWTKRLDVDIRQSLPTIRGQNFIVQLDIFNFLNLLNKNWGSQDLGSSNSPTVLSRASFSGQEGVYRFTPSVSNSQFSTQNVSSNYTMQLQLKYTF